LKRWKSYEKFFQSGDWHVHTSYTHGENTVFEYCRRAEDNGLELIAFTEHIRREPDYDFGDFVSDVNDAKEKFELVILAGAEAKVLDVEGTLDISDEHLKLCEIVLASFHGTAFGTRDEYLLAVKNMLRNPAVDIWAHPTLYAQRMGFNLDAPALREISGICADYGVLIEKNRKYRVPSDDFLKMAAAVGCRIVEGSDAHKVDELREFR